MMQLNTWRYTRINDGTENLSFGYQKHKENLLHHYKVDLMEMTQQILKATGNDISGTN